MRQSLLEKCEAQIRNEAALRKADRFEFELLIKFGALMHVSAECEADARRAKICKHILQDRALVFARFREPLKYTLQTKMALSDDPVAFIEDVLDVYEQLREGRMQPGEVLAMVAAAIVENCPADRRDAAVEKTIAEYEKAKELHGLLANGSDLPLIALAVMAGKDVDQAAGEVGTLLQDMKENYQLESNAAQFIAMVLALSDKPAKTKTEELFGLFDACDKMGHATSADNLMVVYTAFADTDYELGQVVAAIGEVDEWLKKKKGYGSFGIGGYERRLIATLLAFEDVRAEGSAAAPDNADAMGHAFVEDPVPILTMLILAFVIATKAR